MQSARRLVRLYIVMTSRYTRVSRVKSLAGKADYIGKIRVCVGLSLYRSLPAWYGGEEGLGLRV